jgi:hypothetical protein
MSSSASPLHQILAAMADDPYWGTPAATRPEASQTPDRRPTRTTTGGTYNLTWHALQQDHQRNVADFVAQRSDAQPATGAAGTPAARGGPSVYAAAGLIAAADPAAAAEYAAIEHADRLRAAIAIGEGRTAIAAITCPACGCWSLAPVRGLTGWRATCLRRHCATPDGPRTWSLRAIARHHLAADAA